MGEGCKDKLKRGKQMQTVISQLRYPFYLIFGFLFDMLFIQANTGKRFDESGRERKRECL